MSTAIEALTIACAVGAATAAGTFFTFSTFTMAGLRRLAPARGAAAMQAINKEAPTPPFMVLLFGTAAASLVLMTHAIVAGAGVAAWCRIAGGAIYMVGVIAMTIAYHVPRNERLAGFDPDSAEGAAYWAVYLEEWVRMNHVRTVAPVVAAVLFCRALVVG